MRSPTNFRGGYEGLYRIHPYVAPALARGIRPVIFHSPTILSASYPFWIMAILHSLCLLPLLVLWLCSLAYSSKVSLGGLHHSIKKSRIRAELGPLLSSKAVIIDAENGNLTEATKRWQQFASPSFSAVVQVATESDIIQTVSFIIPTP